MKTNNNFGQGLRRPCNGVLITLAISLFLAFTIRARATSTVVANGGFELGNFTDWLLSGNTASTLVSPRYAHSGNYGAQLGPSALPGFLTQPLTTVTGQVYCLSFWLESPGGTTTEFKVAWNGTTLMDITNPPAFGWSNFAFAVTATNGNSILQFGFRNDPSYFGLDDVSVTPVGVGLTFDSLSGASLAVPVGYGGLIWSNFFSLDGVFFGPPSGYQVGVVSTNNVLYNASGAPAAISNSTPFNLYSAYLTAAWNDNLQLEARGYNGGVLVYDNTWILSAVTRTLINFNYLDVNEVEFITSGGTPNVAYGSSSGTQFAMDNMNVTTGPGVQSNPQIPVPLPGPLMGQSAYVRSQSAGEPWGQPDNIVAMNRVFGTNAWQSLYYETVNPAALFNPATHSVFLEGSDQNATALSNFLSANLSTIQTWVSNGGSLFLNAAPTVGASFNFGFGVTLNFTGIEYDDNADGVLPSCPLFNGPFLPVGTNWTGSAFAHATVSGAGLIPMIVNHTNNTMIALGEEQLGSGHALFGGMTVPTYHSPGPQSSNLLANILAYMNNSPEIVFDDLPSTTTGILITNGYRGLNWSNFYEANGIQNISNPSGYQAGTVSTNNIAYNNFGNPASIASTTPFNFVSAELTASWNDNLLVEAQGYAHGLLVYDQTYTLSATNPTLIVFNYLGVTEVVFTSSGGTKHTAYTLGNGTQFAIDNITAAPAPAPVLAITPGGGNTATVSWSSPSVGWSLQQTTNLTNNPWTAPAESVNDGGTNKSITINPDLGTRFFRLIFQ